MIKQKIKSQKKINKSSDNESNKIINFSDPVLESINLNVLYGKVLAVKEVNIQVPKNKVVSLIGPSGCGKSTLIRCFNRMNDTIRIARVNGQVLYNKRDVSDMDPAEVRYRIGMVFQKPNPFPKSIYENVAFGPKVNGIKENLDEIVETSLRLSLIHI